MIQIYDCFDVIITNYLMKYIFGNNDMFILNKTTIKLSFGIFQNISSHNSLIMTIYNSSFMLENTLSNNFHSQFLYSSLGLISIDNCSFNNLNASSLESNFAFKFENKVFFVIKYCVFEYLNNFAYEVKIILSV